MNMNGFANDSTGCIDDQCSSDRSTKYVPLLFNVQPVHLGFFASVPLCFGAYLGYKSEIHQTGQSGLKHKLHSSRVSASVGGLLKRSNGNFRNKKKSSNQIVVKRPERINIRDGSKLQIDAGRLAFKALGIGSLLSVGGMGLITVLVLRVSGCRTLREMIYKCQEWAPRKRKEFEDYFGIEPSTNCDEDLRVTKNMTEKEEWEYIKKKYIPELCDED